MNARMRVDSVFVISSGSFVEMYLSVCGSATEEGTRDEDVHLGLERPLDWKTQILRLHWRQLGQLGVDMLEM